MNFPLLEKQDVNGDSRSELYDYLVNSEVGGGKSIKWNFEKFLVNKEGEVVARFSSMTAPDSAKLHKAIDKVLK